MLLLLLVLLLLKCRVYCVDHIPFGIRANKQQRVRVKFVGQVFASPTWINSSIFLPNAMICGRCTSRVGSGTSGSGTQPYGNF